MRVTKKIGKVLLFGVKFGKQALVLPKGYLQDRLGDPKTYMYKVFGVFCTILCVKDVDFDEVEIFKTD